MNFLVIEHHQYVLEVTLKSRTLSFPWRQAARFLPCLAWPREPECKQQAAVRAGLVGTRSPRCTACVQDWSARAALVAQLAWTGRHPLPSLHSVRACGTGRHPLPSLHSARDGDCPTATAPTSTFFFFFSFSGKCDFFHPSQL